MALFQKQKQEKKRKGENVIGKIIYGFLLFMPLIAVGVACLYTIFNKNAYMSYSDQYVEKIERYDNATNLVEDLNYTFHYDERDINSNQCIILYNEISISWYDYQSSLPQNDYVGFYVYGTATRFLLYYYDNNNTLQSYFSSILATNLTTFEFNFKSATTNSDFNGYFLTNTILTTNKLDNVFYYQMEKLEQQDLFNWTKNTGTYTIMHNTTTLLGITNTYTPMIMTYWLIISVVYFLYDIALILIWAVHDKIHELKDAI